MANKELDIGTLENWLWEAACKIRGEVDAPKYWASIIFNPLTLRESHQSRYEIITKGELQRV